MDEIFSPSLLISLGPSAKKALLFSEKLLSYLPKHFLNVVQSYSIESVDDIHKEIQDIVDTKLLSAKHLNKLVDLGYKVRSENISSVKVNIYLLWDVYKADQSAYEVVKLLSDISYGNLDKDQHSGAALFIIPIMDREWLIDEKESLSSLKKLNKIIDFASEKENILSLDSKIYVLHTVSNDGTRIPLRELEDICGILAYLNILPSKDPPLSHFNKRLLMNEGAYKVGTIGITTLTVFKDRLLNDFARYMCRDILSYAGSFETNIDYKNYAVFTSIDYRLQRNILIKDVSITKEEGFYKLSGVEKFEVMLPKDISNYPHIFKNWEEYLENKCLNDIKRTVDDNKECNMEKVKNDIQEDINNIALKYSLKEAIHYIDSLEQELKNQKVDNRTSINTDTSQLNKELTRRINNYPNSIGYIIKCLIMSTFFLYSLVNIVYLKVPIYTSIIIIILFLALFLLLVYLDYLFTRKRFNTFVSHYKEQVLRKNGALINLYIEKSIAETRDSILKYIYELRSELETCIENCKVLEKTITPMLMEEDNTGILITDLLNFEDRKRFYFEKSPKVSEMYRAFLRKLESYKHFRKEELKAVLLEFAIETSKIYIDLDFFEYMKFKYKDNIIEELSSWVEKSIIKSKYLLQYINSNLLEEHSLFITSPEVYRAAKDTKAEKLSNFQTSIIEGRDIYTNCISIIRLCLGVDFNSITSVKKFRDSIIRESDSEEEAGRGEKNV
jgi:hypothetical protein